MTDQYRFEHSKIYEYDSDKNAYLYLATRLQVGITSRMSEAVKARKIEDYKNSEPYNF